jgi:hypothetical protein
MINYFILVATISALGLLLIALIYVLAIVTGKFRFQTPAEKQAIQKRKSSPKVGPVKQYCIGILLFLLIAMTGCSPKGTLNCGSTYKLIPPKFKA